MGSNGHLNGHGNGNSHHSSNSNGAGHHEAHGQTTGDHSRTGPAATPAQLVAMEQQVRSTCDLTALSCASRTCKCSCA
jgi:hypothetical protein